MDFNLEEQRRTPLTQPLKCLGAVLHLLAPPHLVWYMRALRFNPKPSLCFLAKRGRALGVCLKPPQQGQEAVKAQVSAGMQNAAPPSPRWAQQLLRGCPTSLVTCCEASCNRHSEESCKGERDESSIATFGSEGAPGGVQFNLLH